MFRLRFRNSGSGLDSGLGYRFWDLRIVLGYKYRFRFGFVLRSRLRLGVGLGLGIL